MFEWLKNELRLYGPEFNWSDINGKNKGIK